MKPYELLAALIHQDQTKVFALAKKLGVPEKQSQWSKFINNKSIRPTPDTLRPLATYFKIPLEAMYDDAMATSIAAQRGLRLVDALPKSMPPKKKVSVLGLSAAALKLAKTYDDMPPDDQDRFRALLRVSRSKTAVKKVLLDFEDDEKAG